MRRQQSFLTESREQKHENETRSCSPALDIGGANIKAADGEGWSWSEPFALWRSHERLQEVLHSVIVRCPSLRLVATMTGEIADCYPSRRVGVECIIRAASAGFEWS